jgi:hypothetical protein
VLQANQIDIAFLIARAQRRGYIVCFRETVPEPIQVTETGPKRFSGASQKFMYFGPSNLLQQQQLQQMGERAERLKLDWGSSLLDFRPSINLSTNLWSTVKISFWNRRNRSQRTISYALQDLWKDEHGLNHDLQPIIAAAELGENEVSGVPVHTEGEARDLVRNTLRENFLQVLTAEGTAVGHPELRACSRVRIGGMGFPFDGAYFLTSTTHTIDDGGYRTQFSARREELTEGQA